MTHEAKHLLLLGMFYCTFLSAEAGGNSSRKELESEQCFGFNIFYENDHSYEWLGMAKLNEDRNYTMGVNLFFSGRWLDKAHFSYLHDRAALRFFKDSVNATHTVLKLYNTAFTPDNIKADQPIRDDRPYASLFGVEIAKTYTFSNASKPYSYTFQLALGALGLPIGKEVQTLIHSLRDTSESPIPKGWHNQISNGFELTALVAIEKVQLLAFKAAKDRRDISDNHWGYFDLKYNWKVNAGWYTGGKAGLSFRLGRILKKNSLLMNKPSDNSMMAPMEKAKFKTVPKTKWDGEIYLFGGIDNHLMAYNALMHGQFRQFFEPKHTVAYKNYVPIILYVYGGIAGTVVFPCQAELNIMFMLNARSPEMIYPSRNPRWHSWPTLGLNLSIPGNTKN